MGWPLAAADIERLQAYQGLCATLPKMPSSYAV